MNASCYLEKTGEFATSAAAAGVEYPALMQKIAEAALARYEHVPERARRKRKRRAKAVV